MLNRMHAPCAGTRQLPSARVPSGRGLKLSLRSVAEPSTTVTEKDVKAESGEVADVYLGFDKYDFDRAGRKGKIIKDNPKKYPNKEDMGFFLGVTGGWAGGEVAIAKIKEELQTSKPAAPKPAAAPAAESTSLPSPQPGQDLLYIGFRKDELDLRKSGAKGRFIADDPNKYPDKENVGPMLGATGGFAGGEAGLQQFVQTGELKLRQPGDPVKKQFSPLTLAGGMALIGGGGGIALATFLGAEGVIPSGEGSLFLSVGLGAVCLGAAAALVLGSVRSPRQS